MLFLTRSRQCQRTEGSNISGAHNEFVTLTVAAWSARPGTADKIHVNRFGAGPTELRLGRENGGFFRSEPDKRRSKGRVHSRSAKSRVRYVKSYSAPANMRAFAQRFDQSVRFPSVPCPCTKTCMHFWAVVTAEH